MNKTALVVLLLLVGFGLFFLRLGHRALWSSDEGRYAEIPREMIEQNDYVSPHLNYVKYFEKPPLVYWLTAVNFRLFSPSEAASRFWPAFLGALGLVATWFFARRWFGPPAGLWSAWFLLTCVGYFLVGRYLVLDMPFTFFLSVGLLCFLEGFEGEKKYFLPAAYVLWGLATLVKGVVACAFPFLIVAAYLTWTRQWNRWRQTGLLWGIPLTIAVVLPWFVLVCRRNSEFFQFFFIHEHVQRFLTHSAGRKGPLYYFFGIGMAFFFPWSLFVFFTGRRLCTWRAPQTPQDRKRLFLLVWIVIVFCFFTVSRSKLPPYILPILPPLAMLTGFWVKELLDAAGTLYRKVVPVVFGTAFAAVLAGAVVLTVYLAVTKKPEKALIEHYIYVVSAIFVTGSGIAFLCSRRPAHWRNAFLAWGCAILLAYPVVIFAMERLDSLQSRKELAAVIQKVVRPDESLAIYGGVERFSDLPFYLKRRVMIVGTNIGELTFGSRIGDQRAWFLSVEQFGEHLRQARTAGKNVFCVVRQKEYNELLEKGIQSLEVLHRTPGAVLLVQRPAKKN